MVTVRALVERGSRARARADQVALHMGVLCVATRPGADGLPAGSNRVARLHFPFDNVRVLIVGQDPIHPGHAVGLSFSVAPDVRPWRSSANIFDEYTADYPLPSNGDLILGATCKLLLEQGADGDQQPRRRTVRGLEAVTGMRDSRLGGAQRRWWRSCGVVTRHSPADVTAGNCVAIESPHPPLSASRGFFRLASKLRRAERTVSSMGAEPIDWRLP